MADLPNPLNSLPQEITSDIFSRLPDDSILDCKLVCRSWRNLLQFHVCTNFAYQHLERKHDNTTMMGFVHFDEEAQALYYSEYYEGENSDKQQPIYTTRRMDLEFPIRMFGLVGSCNGLICLSATTKYKGMCLSHNNGSYHQSCPSEEPSYICNPITREFVSLPAICIDKKKLDKGVGITCGFGYHPLTNEYKVVRIFYFGAANLVGPVEDLAPDSGLVEIYTLGSGSGWRPVGETDAFLGTSVFANGSLYWICKKSGEIVSFDLADEKFHVIPNPPGRLEKICKLCILRSCLCLITVSKFSSGKYDLWFLKKNKEDDSTCSYRKVEESYKSWSWSKEFSMKWKLNGWYTLFWLFALTNRSEFLFMDNGIIRYNSNTKKYEKIWLRKDRNRNQKKPVSHINSFVSLKALGEKNVETYRIYRR